MRVCVLGHFAFGKEAANGQTVKTKILTKELVRQLGENEVRAIDTCGGMRSLLKAPFQAFFALKNASNVIILPAHNGVRVYGRLLPLFRGLFKNRKIHYVVIGGWLPDFVRDRKGLAAALKRFDGIYVETSTMKTALDGRGFENVFVMSNCKELNILEKEELLCSANEPYKLCTFSRVMREKGMEDAIEAVKAVNRAQGEAVYTLDIYGPVDPAQTQWFEELKSKFPNYVRYCGVVPSEQSVETVKNYFALLFPTGFYTEGIPGTIIDAYAAGVPVISAKWESFADVVDDGETGYGYEFGNTEALKQMLSEVAENPDKITNLKENCLKKAQDYMPQKAIDILLQKMEG